MKKYFITSDIHSFFEPFFTALINSGFSWYNPEHFLIILGDVFDRGPDSKRVLDFLYSLQELNRLILIRGNHEDLLQQCLYDLKDYHISTHHISNGTIDTIAQLTNINKYDILIGDYKYTTLRRRLCKYFKLINQAKNYYELDDYIFVHGWIPQIKKYEDLERCPNTLWEYARWYNGMEYWNLGFVLEGKKIVCGHWHTSFGNYNYHHKGSGEFEEDSDFGIFEDDGIIALDACTAYSKKVNIKVLEI